MSAGAGAVYLCYFPLSDPLVESQVLAYLKGLARVGFRIHLITFEIAPGPLDQDSIRERLRTEGIGWSCLYYHRGGSLLRKAFEGLRGVLRLIRVVLKNDLRIVHARAHSAALMAYPVARLLGRKVLFDVRGLIADEYADIGHWSRSSLVFRGVKRAERLLLKRADAVVFLTQAVVRDFVARGTLSDQDLKRVSVIPCCVDVPPARPDRRSPAFVLAYLGKLGSWYLGDEILRFFAAIKRHRPEAKLMVLTQSPAEDLREGLTAMGLSPDDVSIGAAKHSEVGLRLGQASAAVAFYKPGYSKLATSPTKVSDYLAAGLPVVINAGIGDCDDLLARNQVGVSLNEFSELEIERAAAGLITLSETAGIGERCRSVAVAEFDLQSVGVARYRAIYNRLSA